MKSITRMAGVLLLILILAACSGKIENFVYEPDFPGPGKQIQVVYNPEGTKLEGADNVEMFYFQSDGKNLQTESVFMKKEGDTFTTSITPENNTRAIVFKFVSDELEDTNNKNGYRLLYRLNHQKPIKGARVAMADLLFNNGFFAGIERSDENQQLALNYLEEEFDEYPESRKDYLTLYYNIILRYKDKQGEEIVKNDIKKYLTKTNLSVPELETFINLSNRLGLENEENEFRVLLKNADKNNEVFAFDDFSKFRAEKDIDKKINMVQFFKENHKDFQYMDYMHSQIIKDLIEKSGEKGTDDYIAKFPEARTSGLYEALAKKMLEKGNNTNALKLTETAVEIARAELENPTNEKPEYLSTRQWKEEREVLLAACLDTYSKILDKTGDKKGCLRAITEAVNLSKKENRLLNEAYVMSLLDNGSDEKAISEISGFITTNYATEKMDDLFAQASIKSGKNETQLTTDLTNLKMKGKENLKNKLMNELEEYTAPAFTLKDLEGKTVRLADFKGKTVLVDFWATWCPPCRASFPTMKKMVEKYKDSKDVAIIFLNTRDHDDQRIERIQNFLSKNNYPFYVLLDDENNSANKSYKIPGIPTKLIVDKDGNVRYFHVGWSGDEAAEMQKLDVLFEIIGQ
ncbi:MAG: TlpA family protein disulfide reductase [Acidobacteria bacterium]|nr:TlpA family protein disulfide reductase [Acidobacteriota bacterium]